MQLAAAETDYVLKKLLGLITARGGSRSIPRKNIVLLAGRPLLVYTVETSLGSQKLTRVVLSTEDEEIARIGRESGAEVPFMRPNELAQDTSGSLEVAQHAVRWLEDNEGWRADAVVILQPTSPLRRSEQIDRGFEIMDETGADTVVSVVEVPHNFNPYSLMQLEDGRLTDFWKEPLDFNRYRRQEIPLFYARNGPAVLITRYKTLMEDKTFYGEHIAPLFMSWEDSHDIDTPMDFEIVEWLLKRRK